MVTSKSKGEPERIPCNVCSTEYKNEFAPSATSSLPSTETTDTLTLHNLDCADCAAEIEKAVCKISGVRSADMNFVAGRLTIEAERKALLPAILNEAEKTIHRMEPDVRIIREGTEQPEKVEEEKSDRLSMIAFGTGAILFLIGILIPLPQNAKFAVFLASLLFSGGKVLLQAARNILHGRVFDENFLMAVASVGAFCIGEFSESVAVMLFYQVGEFFQERAVRRSRSSIASLMDIRPDYANLKTNGETRRVSPEEIRPDDRILIFPGEKVPLDGVVEDGTSFLDTSALTGESAPRRVSEGNEIYSGFINQTGVLTVRVTKEFGQSTVNKILDMVQNASSKKAPAENFITKFAKIYTPAVVFSAIALAVIPPLVIPGAQFYDWLSRALTFLVVSCPCALVLSIPLSFFGGIGAASKNGILVKGSNYLEALNRVDTVVFDKTGTLTKGTFRVVKISAAGDTTQEEVLRFAAHAELYSSHPIALAVRSEYQSAPDASLVADYEEIPGKGIRASVDGKAVLAGNAKLLADAGIKCPEISESGAVVYLAVNGQYAGNIVIADETKDDSAATIRNLKASGIHTSMLTGDNRAAGEKVAKALGLESVYTDLLPLQKVEQMERFRSRMHEGGKLVFVGDGMNDAPVLAQADVGVAMGGIGSDAAIEAADIVLMTDEPSKLVTAIRIARKTHRIVWENIILALGVKFLILILAAFGFATMWAAVFGDVGVTMIAVLNSIRVISSGKKRS